jgi:hypothetical protein
MPKYGTELMYIYSGMPEYFLYLSSRMVHMIVCRGDDKAHSKELLCGSLRANSGIAEGKCMKVHLHSADLTFCP